MKMLLVFKLINELTKCDWKLFLRRNEYIARGHIDKLVAYKPLVKTTPKLNSFSNRAISKWNNLPNNVINSHDLDEFKSVFFWYLLFSAGCLLFLVGFKILFFWYCLLKTVGLGGIPNLMRLELQGFAGFERILVLMCFLCDNLA